jgi:DNA polymerase III epsilon subunit family exonuclease
MKTQTSKICSPKASRVDRRKCSWARMNRPRTAIGCGIVLGASILFMGIPLTARAQNGGAQAINGAGYPSPRWTLANVTFVAFDTETTGLDPKRDRIVELAAVKYRGGEVLEKKTWLINPERAIPCQAQKVHGIPASVGKGQPTFARIYPEFEDFAEGCVLIAHNARFNVSFVSEEVSRAGLPQLPNPVIDSLFLFRSWYPGLTSYRLENLVKHTGVPEGGFHRALADSIYIALIFERGSKRLGESATLQDIYAATGGPLFFREPFTLRISKRQP